MARVLLSRLRLLLACARGRSGLRRHWEDIDMIINCIFGGALRIWRKLPVSFVLRLLLLRPSTMLSTSERR